MKIQNEHAFREGVQDCASPQVAVVVLHAATLEEFEVFVLEGLQTMVGFLVCDVLTNGGTLRCADGEGAVSFLPCEI